MYPTILRFFALAVFISIIISSCKKEKSLPAPTGLSITNISDSGCSISWISVNGADNYKITIATDNAFMNAVSGYNELTVSNPNINVTGLTPYTKYYVKVVAFGGGSSSSAVTGDFMTNDADGLVIMPWDQSKLYAFDARNGNVKWIFSGASFFGTPIIQDSVVYVGSMDGRVYALNVIDGSQKWRTVQTTNGAMFTANPLIKNGVVYIGDYGGRCHAYRASDGAAIWAYDIPSPYKNVNSTPILNGNTVYFASYDGKIYALDAGTGAYKWATASTGNPISSGMSLVNGTLYVGAMPKVYAFDAGTGATKWVTPTPVFTSYSSSPTVADNTVFIGGEDAKMYAFNTTDGSIAWSKTLNSGSIMSSPVYKNGIIYVGGGDGKIYALESSTGNQIWVNSDAGSIQNVYSGPTVSDRAVYSGTLGGKVIAMNLQTGATKWITTVPGARFQASPCVIAHKGNVYYPGLSGDVQ